MSCGATPQKGIYDTVYIHREKYIFLKTYLRVVKLKLAFIKKIKPIWHQHEHFYYILTEFSLE